MEQTFKIKGKPVLDVWYDSDREQLVIRVRQGTKMETHPGPADAAFVAFVE